MLEAAVYRKIAKGEPFFPGKWVLSVKSLRDSAAQPAALIMASDTAKTTVEKE